MPEKLTLDALRDDPSTIESFYFDAVAQEGYASMKPHPQMVPSIPCAKQIVFERGVWLFRDICHITHGSGFSGGSTVIYFDQTPVWMMLYFGYYPKHLLPFLQEALSEEARKKSFNGGRGPKQHIFKKEGLIYRNQARTYRFDYFSGQETLQPTGEGLNENNSGWHLYHGGLML